MNNLWINGLSSLQYLMNYKDKSSVLLEEDKEIFLNLATPNLFLLMSYNWL